jgi:hypothetical protein
MRGNGLSSRDKQGSGRLLLAVTNLGIDRRQDALQNGAISGIDLEVLS